MNPTRLAVTLLASTCLASCGGGGGGGGGGGANPEQVPPIGLRVARQFSLSTFAGAAAFTWSLASDGTSIFLYRQVIYPDLTSNTQAILKIDPDTGLTMATYGFSCSPVPQCYLHDLTWHGGALWATGGMYVLLDTGILRLDLAGATATASILKAAGAGISRVGEGLEGLASDGTSIYVGAIVGGATPRLGVVTFNPSTSTEVPSTPFLDLGYQPKSMSFGGGYLWSISNAADVAKIDPVTGVTVQRYNTAASVLSRQGLLYLGGLLWMIHDDSRLVAYYAP